MSMVWSASSNFWIRRSEIVLTYGLVRITCGWGFHILVFCFGLQGLACHDPGLHP